MGGLGLSHEITPVAFESHLHNCRAFSSPLKNHNYVRKKWGSLIPRLVTDAQTPLSIIPEGWHTSIVVGRKAGLPACTSLSCQPLASDSEITEDSWNFASSPPNLGVYRLANEETIRNLTATVIGRQEWKLTDVHFYSRARQVISIQQALKGCLSPCRGRCKACFVQLAWPLMDLLTRPTG